MKTAQFVKLLSTVRRADDAMGETLTEIGVEVLEQWHKHGNRTPHMQLLLAIDGGTDAHGFFGAKGAELRGVSKGIGQLFTGLRKLGKQDANADVEVLAQTAIDTGMKTRGEAAADAKAKREASAKAKAKADAKAQEEQNEQPEEVVGALVLMSGAAIKLTPEEVAALERTLRALRQIDANEIIDVQANEVREPVMALAAAA